MPLDAGRVTHLAEQMHRSEDDAGDPIDDGFLLAADGARGLEWVDPATISLTNPMTTAGDIIVGDTGGTPARLAKGSDGQVLTVDPTTHLLVWATPSAGFTNPMTTKGDLIVGDTGGSAIRKAVGSNGQVLTADSASTGGVKWDAVSGSGTLTTVEEVDGSPTDSAVTKLVFPNGTLSIASHVATYTPAGGGGSSTIQYGANKPATPDDDFDASSLSGSWIARSAGGSFATTDCYTQALDGSHLSMGFKSSMGYIYLSASDVDQEWQCGGMRGLGQTGSVTAMMFGIALLDTSGDGMGVVVYNDNNIYLARITGHAYASFDGTIANMGHNINPASRWDLRLTRVGNTWDGYASHGGDSWAFHSTATGSRTITVARKCVGLFYNTSDLYKGEVLVDWVDTA